MKRVRFESIGVYLPEKVVTTQELIDQMTHKPQFDLEDLTGIHERRWRADDEDSHVLAMKAARNCLANSVYKPEDIDVIISCSITRFNKTFYQLEPALSKGIKQELGLKPSAINFDITNACAGMMTGVYILESMIKTGLARNGMIISGECITPITETAVREISEIIDPQFASMTVGDSGAACILDNRTVNGEGIQAMEMFCLGEYADLCFGMPSEKSSGIAMYTDAMTIHKEVIDRLPDIIYDFIEKYGVSADDYDFVIPHQTSGRAIKTAMDLCVPLLKNQDTDYVPEVLVSLDKVGNTSSTSHFVVMDDYLKRGVIKKGSRILNLVMASGIILGTVSVTLGEMNTTH